MSSSSKPTNGVVHNPYELPWYVLNGVLKAVMIWLSRVEKYRPNILDEVVGNAETIDRLKVIAKEGNCPHIIISVRLYTLLHPFYSPGSRDCQALEKQLVSTA